MTIRNRTYGGAKPYLSPGETIRLAVRNHTSCDRTGRGGKP